MKGLDAISNWLGYKRKRRTLKRLLENIEVALMFWRRRQVPR